MKLLFLLLLSALSLSGFAQGPSEEDKLIARLTPGNSPTAGLLSSRSVVLFSADFVQKELEEIQTGFQQIGIDAVSYIESERALAGPDLMNSYGHYFIVRNIKVLIMMKKNNQEYQIYFFPFNAKPGWIEPSQPAWWVRATSTRALLTTVFRALISSQKRSNFLINDFPERSGPASTIAGHREEDWAPSVRVAKIAIPRMWDEESDKQLDLFLKENLHAKYEWVDQNADENELVEKNFIYVLRFVHTRGALAKDILGYDLSKSESALATVNYPNGMLQLKTIPSGTSVYKFYLKNIEDDVYFLGKKWDADLTWQDALKNYVDAYKASGKLN